MLYSIYNGLSRTLANNFAKSNLAPNSKLIINNFWQTSHNLFFAQQIQQRNKYTKGKSKQTDDEYDSDSDNFDLDNSELEKDAKLIQTKVNSLRVDVILKSGLNLSRNKIEAAFYQNRIRINEERLSKKSANVRIGDEIDLIKDVSPSNPAFILISRVILMSATEKGENYIVGIKRFKNLLIENYKDPWKPSGDNTN